MLWDIGTPNVMTSVPAAPTAGWAHGSLMELLIGGWVSQRVGWKDDAAKGAMCTPYSVVQFTSAGSAGDLQKAFCLGGRQKCTVLPKLAWLHLYSH